MISYNRLATEIYEILQAPKYGFTMKLYNEEGDSTITPRNVKWIYVKPEDIIIRLPINSESDVDTASREVFFWKSKMVDHSLIRELMKRIRIICNLYGVGLTVKDFERSEMKKKFSDMTARETAEYKMEESIKHAGDAEMERNIHESMTGNQRRSYYVLENARLIAVHEGLIHEEKRGARSRNIKEMYVESGDERFKVPGNYMMGGRALTRHLHEGGSVLDSVGKRILEACKEAVALKSFVKEYKKSNASDLLEMARTRVSCIRESCGKMAGPKGYRNLKETFGKKPRIGKDRINEMVQVLAADLGLNESEELHEGLAYLAPIAIMENGDLIRDVEKILDHVCDDNDKKGKHKAAAKELVTKKVGNNLSKAQQTTFSFMKGQSVKSLMATNDEEIAEYLYTLADSVKDEMIQRIFRKIIDKVINRDEVKKHELVVADMIKDGVLGKVTEDSSMVEDALHEVETFINESIFQPFLNEYGYPDDFRGTPHDKGPSDRTINRAVDELNRLAKEGVALFMEDGPAAYDLDLQNLEDFDAAISQIVDDNVYAEIQSEYPDIFELSEMEAAVRTELTKVFENSDEIIL